MEKHTPGPWYFDGNDYVREQSSDYLIARIEDECGHTVPRHRVAMPKKANARLIAAAPELRAAGALALNQLSYALQRASFEEDNVAITAINIAMSKLRAALAKADGKP